MRSVIAKVGDRKRDVIDHRLWGTPRRPAGREYGIAANDVPLTHIICRTRPRDAPAGAGSGPPRRTPKAVIDHIAFTVADFDPARAKAQFAAVGVSNVRDGGPFSVYVDDPFGYELQISGVGVTATCGAEARATCGDTR